MSMDDGWRGRASGGVQADGRGGEVLRLAAESDASGARGGPDRVGLTALCTRWGSSAPPRSAASAARASLGGRSGFGSYICVSSGHSAEVSALDDLLGDRERGCGRG